MVHFLVSASVNWSNVKVSEKSDVKFLKDLYGKCFDRPLTISILPKSVVDTLFSNNQGSYVYDLDQFHI